MNKRISDSMKEKMEYRRGCFMTKSQAKRIDSIREELDILSVEYFEEIGGDLLLSTKKRDYYMTRRGKIEYYNDNDKMVVL